MSRQTLNLNSELYEYLQRVSLREAEILHRLREETARLPMARMQISPEQGQFMALLARLINAQRCIEVGVYTGYSALAVAQALPDEGYLLACDVDEEATAVARRYWSEAGVDQHIDLQLRPAVDTLNARIHAGECGNYDLAFIDADKSGYMDYFEACLRLLRPGGLVMVDNVLWGGNVIDPDADDEDTRAIRAFNQILLQDQRVEISLLPIGDGLTLARKR